MKTLFIIPPFPARTYSGKTMAPDYLAGALINHRNVPKEDIEILDLDVLGKNVLEKRLKNNIPDLVGISYLSFQTEEAMQIAKQSEEILRKKGRRIENSKNYVPIIVGGHGTSKCDEIINLYPEIDVWAVGEGLETILEIADLTKEGKFLEQRRNIAGIKYFEKNSGQVQITSKRSLVRNIDEFIPARLNHYPRYDFEVFNNKKTAQVMSQMGCRGAYVYCFESTSGKIVRKRSVESIESEIQELVEEGYKAIYFDDSTFTWNKKRTLDIVDVMKKFHKNNGIIWGFDTRVDCLDKSLIRKIKNSGCEYMFSGIESLDSQVLAGMNKIKGGSPDYELVKSEQDYINRAKQTFKWMEKIGQTKCSFLIFGGPTLSYETVNEKKKSIRGIETMEQAKETNQKVVWDLNPEYISINVLRFIPNAVMSSSMAFSNLRGQKEKIHAGYFSKKWKKINKVKEENFRKHPIYMAFEAAGQDYPIPPHMTPKYCYSLLEDLVKQVNLKTKQTGKQTNIVVDKTFEQYMPRDRSGIYHLSSFEKLSSHKQKFKPTISRSRIKSFVKPALALAASVALTLGVHSYNSQNLQDKEYISMMQPTLNRLSKDSPYFDKIVSYVKSGKNELGKEDIFRVLILHTMQSTGQDYVIYSKYPKILKDFNEMNKYVRTKKI